MNIPYSKVFRGGLVVYFIVSVLAGLLAGVSTFVTTGDAKPLADNSIGLLVSSDNQAFQLEKDWEAGKFETIDLEYREIVKSAAIQKIVSSIVITIIVLFGLFKLVRVFFEWNQPVGTKWMVLAAMFTLSIYSFLGILYFMFDSVLSGQSLTGNLIDLLVAGIPLKSFFYGIKVLIGVLI